MATSYPFANFDVLVGSDPDQKMFTVQRDLLVSRSKFFDTVRSNRWTTRTQSSLKPVDLSEEDPDMFEAYLYCVYFDEVTPVARNEDGAYHYDSLIELHTLADMDFTTADLVIDKIISFVHERLMPPDLEDIRLVYDTTVEGSPLRRLFVDYRVFCMGGYLSGPKHEYPHEYLEEVVTMFIAHKDPVNKAYKRPKKYVPRPDPDDTSRYHRDAHAELMSYIELALVI